MYQDRIALYAHIKSGFEYINSRNPFQFFGITLKQKLSDLEFFYKFVTKSEILFSFFLFCGIFDVA